jgi:ATP-dependent exoDNAse (exonuclease V) alpha subunit
VAEGKPVKRIVLLYTGCNASKVSVEDTDNLLTELLVCISAQVMLMTNTWTENRLVNRLIGTVEDILWDTGKDLSVDMPSVLLVHFSEYSGPDFPNYGPKIIPIFPVTCQFEYKSIPCSCTQFPLRLAYAITVHKSQGLTLSQVVLNLDQKEHCLGLSYVAISQVKALDRLMFESPFDFSRFTVHNTPTARDRELDISVRKKQIL